MLLNPECTMVTSAYLKGTRSGVARKERCHEYSLPHCEHAIVLKHVRAAMSRGHTRSRLHAGQ
ncbi:hypothetical protein HBI56_101610 [Parastagonospora nodorum]|uniref:Uncharacterized protein n=1 Tax=Phaeosphaeria nodorum (strain SN15 / ATCC MYA-4574 / FGSC 10173) TaxID=321614 RepID=A0A7U2F6B0_PHANO|nr:hypothetical protein HBH56_030570 [Parastagonospora nodorum]QRC99291.1 hypothetical protein JI435_413220 [Parastagonospora nodorum SN15]KAH3934104.1 hypothetical protein HBH54_051440 [Parastagonospora nodorum]KAH3943042.1 hypothetical protein HBH53_179240 [Parastagonospora nodorum]KAH3959295.1 hypothetical protein HBH51_201590 [Parastagonospora nodorum]